VVTRVTIIIANDDNILFLDEKIVKIRNNGSKYKVDSLQKHNNNREIHKYIIFVFVGLFIFLKAK
tara:strand:+ start:917 stop:1111 length:195 start_codon:yes stop_codon:yes gene_type:complete